MLGNKVRTEDVYKLNTNPQNQYIEAERGGFWNGAWKNISHQVVVFSRDLWFILKPGYGWA